MYMICQRKNKFTMKRSGARMLDISCLLITYQLATVQSCTKLCHQVAPMPICCGANKMNRPADAHIISKLNTNHHTALEHVAGCWLLQRIFPLAQRSSQGAPPWVSHLRETRCCHLNRENWHAVTDYWRTRLCAYLSRQQALDWNVLYP